MSMLFNAGKGTAIKHGMKLVVTAAAALLLATATKSPAQNLSEVADFGSNPGNLQMFAFVPNALPANSPLVVALHGCTQAAAKYDDETGWVRMAERVPFALLLPQQQSSNNPRLCFNWFEANDIARDRGEALSIKQMIDKMVRDHAIDPKRIFITGLSAGGAMTSVMLATYPELFAGGAIIAGLPYKCATSIPQAFSCMNPGNDLAPGTWAAQVRNASPHQGPWPILSIWHGTTDHTVAPMNAQELVDQWTEVHGIDQVADGQDTVNGHTRKTFKDADGKVLVESYLIANMGHGTPVSPGSGGEQCGTTGPHILDAGICSSFHIATFWGLIAQSSPDTPLRRQMLDQIETLNKKLNELKSKVEQIKQ